MQFKYIYNQDDKNCVQNNNKESAEEVLRALPWGAR